MLGYADSYYSTSDWKGASPSEPGNRVAQEFNFQQDGRYRWTFRWPLYWQ